MVNRTSELLRTGGVIPPYQKGFFVSTPLTDISSGGVINLSTSLVVPIKIENSINVDAVAIRAGATAYSGWKFGLYTINSSASPALGTAVIEATGLNSGFANTVTVHAFSSILVPRGTYWFALAAQGGSGDIGVMTTPTLGGGLGGVTTTELTGAITLASANLSGGFGLTGDSAAASNTFSGQDVNWPIAGLRVA